MQAKARKGNKRKGIKRRAGGNACRGLAGPIKPIQDGKAKRSEVKRLIRRY